MKHHFSSHNVQRFSIRKYSFGAASVLLGSFLVLGTQAVSADEQIVTVESTPTTEIIAKSCFATTNDVEQTTTTEIVSANSVTSTASESSVAENTATVQDVETSTSVDEQTTIEPANTTLQETVETPVVEVAEKSATSEETNQATKVADPEQEKTLVVDTEQVQPQTSDTVVTDTETTTAPEVNTETDETTKKNEESSETITVSMDDFETLSNLFESRYSGNVSSANASDLERILGASLVVSDGSVARGDDYPSNLKSAAPDTVIDQWRLYNRECTSFTAYRLSSVNHFTIPGAYGNGGQWGGRAKQEGYKVDMNPAKGSVAWLDDGSYGHVAWVSNVIGNNVEIEEYNYRWNHNYNKRTVAKTAFTGYIHFKDLDNSSSTSTGNNSGSTNTGSSLQSSGTYHFTSRVGIKSEPKISSADIAYYDNGDSVNYDKTLQADNYQWISYVSYSGARRYVAVNKLAAEVTPIVKGTISVQNKNDQAGTFDVVISNVSSNCGLKEVQVPIWSTQNDQDDIIWYKAAKQSDGTYKTSVNISNHKNNRGEYNIHLYYVVDSGKSVGVATAKTTVAAAQATSDKPTGTISIMNKNDQTGTFDVIISNVYSPKGVKEVKVPTWATQNDQDDIIWYTASKQNDGTYKVSVKASEHKNYQGEYNIHLYYVQNDNQTVGVAVAKTNVSYISKPNIPNSGSYTFSSRASIKGEPKVSAPELAYYDAGNSVNYDKVLLSDGHYWISYIATSGSRRYISIT